MNGILKEIWIGETAGMELTSVQTADVETGKGIVGDRYYLERGTFSEKLKGTPDVEMTLIEQEEIDRYDAKTGRDLTGKDFRRNLVTEGVRLNDLVGKEFEVGDVVLKGIRLCEPCAHLAGILGEDVLHHTAHRAGLRAQVVSGGRISVSDTISG